MQALQQVKIHQLKNGVTLLGEPMDDAASAAVSIMVPLGAATDSPGFEGISNVLTEMLIKGAGKWDARALAAEFENIGAQRSQSSGIEVCSFTAAVLGENLHGLLNILSTMLLEPHLPPDELESVRQLALQEIRSLEDEPASKVMVELAEQYYPAPFGRPQMGTIAGVQAITPQALKDYYRANFVPQRALIGIAGKFDWKKTTEIVEHLFGSWSGSTAALAPGKLPAKSNVHHLPRDTSQVQIALAYPSVSVDHPDSAVAKVATGVLSGGMSGRLFIEVREKRGLVYRVSASYSGPVGRPGIFVYAGTTPKHAEETLSVTMTELKRLASGVSEEELARSKADLKSRVVMNLETSSSRASQLVNDYWFLKRVRSLDELKSAIDRVSNDDIKRHLNEYPVSPVTLVTLGPKALELPA